MSTTVSSLFVGCVMKAARITSTMASATRLAQYPDGKQVLQGAYQWQEGFRTGFEWRDLPVVMVNVFGQETIDD